MKTKKKISTNLDFCVKSNLSVGQMLKFQRDIGIGPIDKFLSAKCGFVPKFKAGDILVGPTSESNFVVCEYDEDDFTYSLFDAKYISDFRLGGYHCAVKITVKKAYELEATHTRWGCIEKHLIDYVDFLDD